jgi:hypothetical protein
MHSLLKFLPRACLFLGSVAFTAAQSADLQQFIQSQPKIPSSQALERALNTASLTDHGSPFHAILEISQPNDSKSPFQGTIEVYWASSSQYRVMVTSKSFSQTRIVNRDQVEEDNTGDFYPAWLRNYVRALMDPLPRAEEFRGDESPIMLGANITQSCVSRDARANGITDLMTWAEICFAGSEPRIKSAIDFTYFMEFGDYQPFGTKLVAHTYTTYTDGNQTVVGRLIMLDPLNSANTDLFTIEHPTPSDQRIETKFVSMAMNESLIAQLPTIDWAPVHEGKTEGNMIVHIITDRTGQVREAHKHNSDNPGAEDFGVQQAFRYKFKPLLVEGVPVQMETPLVLHFKTQIADPVPVITGKDIDSVVSRCHYNPALPKGLLPSGTTFKIRVSVNEQGKNTGEIFPSGIPWNIVQKAGQQLQSCKFKIYLVNGQLWYHHIDFVFTEP